MTQLTTLLSAFVLAAPAAPAGSVQVYAHRGGRSFAPENTLPAYRAALSIGADWVDMDVVLTKDGEVLVSHDLLVSPNLARDSAGRYITKGPAAKDLTLRELQSFDVGRLNPESAYAKFFPDQVPVDGTHMPTLREVARYVEKAARHKMGFQIEMKTDPAQPERSPDPKAFAQALHRILKEEGIIGRAEIQAFDWRCLSELRRLDRNVKTAYLTSRDNEPGGPDSFYGEDPKAAGLWTGGALVKDYGGSIPRMVKALGGFAWEPEDAELTQAALAEAHRLGLKVVVWSWPEKLGTTFDAGLVAKLLSWGVDGIITDDPGRLASMLAARGLRVPPRYPGAGK
ncbi:MAG: glycerophosphodiester phosphodiesterase family protein [Elusimicrobia bacterium]|nr:glycerophosphodiester phosphodiesterase family protein [Elusimicrobiota bacterium]